ncbi:MAG: DnaB-like helicase N-terminal domain-containing protein, partial [Gammaproteobacteria bacterium]|nr:DnaB-like helicase N-terminal domain-containing protein [Gammaproteobacteria bacterium]
MGDPMADAVSRFDDSRGGTDRLRVPPHSTEAEQAVLGGLMLDNSSWDQIADRLVEDDFYRYDHRLIFRAIENLSEATKPADVVTIGEWLEGKELLDEAGGLAYIGALAKDAPGSA